MFWKRKGKKKDGEEPGSTEAEPSTVKTAAEDDPVDVPEAEDVQASGAKEEEVTDGTVTDHVSGDATDTGDAAAEDGESKGADEDGADATEEVEPEVPGTTEPDSDGIQRVRTAGVLTLEEGEFDVVSNTWIVDADDEGVMVIDPAHDARAILDAVGEREIYLVVCTNGYNTHVSAAVEVADRDDAPIALHPRELRSWRRTHGAERRPDHEIEGGGTLEVGDLEVDVLAIPGTSNGSVGLYVAERAVVFTGDTLRKDELGTVGEGYIDYTRQLHSVGEVLLSLPPDTRVLPDSGAETTVGQESKNFDSWVATS